MNSEFIQNLISSDNTKKVNYVILFFIFFIALSQNTFKNLFGCKLNSYFKNVYFKHLISILFLFLLIDININPQDKNSAFKSHNPLLSLFYTTLIYVLVFLLLHCNKIYILFISLIIFILIIIDRVKQYYEFNISDQEILQENLGFLYKMNNVFVIIIILTIIIGTLTSLNLKELYMTFLQDKKNCI